MSNNPLVSVIIPTHNRPEFLKKTLKSIINQNYKNLQIIVVSNGFSNQNKKTVLKFQDSRLEYYEQEDSGGPASPRNHGIKQSKGKYIAFCDDDDLWMPDKIKKQVDVLEQNTDYGLCYTKMLRFDENREWSDPYDSGHATFQSLLYSNTVPISSVLLKKLLIDQIGGFSESSKVGNSEDYEFMLRHSLQTKLYFLDEFLIKYWSGDNRTTCLNFNNSITNVFSYIRSTLNIYKIIYQNSNTGLFEYLRPAIFNIKGKIKAMAFILLQKIGIK